MRCPFCGNEDTQVKDSRPTDDNAAIRRRRQCPNCGARFKADRDIFAFTTKAPERAGLYYPDYMGYNPNAALGADPCLGHGQHF